jgi:hypothetical protein
MKAKSRALASSVLGIATELGYAAATAKFNEHERCSVRWLLPEEREAGPSGAKQFFREPGDRAGVAGKPRTRVVAGASPDR